MNDNWKHRTQAMSCGTCMHFVNMRCRRHAPTMQGFPAVFPGDFCGDHKLDKDTMTEMVEEQLRKPPRRK